MYYFNFTILKNKIMKQNKSNEYTEWYNHLGIWYRGNFKNSKAISYHESNWTNSIGQKGTEVYFYIK
jgi:hypothetical protein